MALRKTTECSGLDEMTDKEMVLSSGSRSEWDWNWAIASSMDRDLALIQEALRRILQHQIDEGNSR